MEISPAVNQVGDGTTNKEGRDHQDDYSAAEGLNGSLPSGGSALVAERATLRGTDCGKAQQDGHNRCQRQRDADVTLPRQGFLLPAMYSTTDSNKDYRCPILTILYASGQI